MRSCRNQREVACNNQHSEAIDASPPQFIVIHGTYEAHRLEFKETGICWVGYVLVQPVARRAPLFALPLSPTGRWPTPRRTRRRPASAGDDPGDRPRPLAHRARRRRRRRRPDLGVGAADAVLILHLDATATAVRSWSRICALQGRRRKPRRGARRRLWRLVRRARRRRFRRRRRPHHGHARRGQRGRPAHPPLRRVPRGTSSSRRASTARSSAATATGAARRVARLRRLSSAPLRRGGLVAQAKPDAGAGCTFNFVAPRAGGVEPTRRAARTASSWRPSGTRHQGWPADRRLAASTTSSPPSAPFEAGVVLRHGVGPRGGVASAASLRVVGESDVVPDPGEARGEGRGGVGAALAPIRRLVARASSSRR